ncbi:hypothetical protein [Pseudomonas purpurea]|uniref:hypothetical protein n=1 Tax=Pseudomonas purpurea TaxID=3136737 RepID=UPI0032672284
MAVDLQLAVVASLLRRGKALDQLSTGLTLIGAAIGLIPMLVYGSLWMHGLCAALVIFGLLQKYWALRVAFDADLFQLMADSTQPLPECTLALDQVLQNLRLKPANGADRPWDERSRGALKLLRNQTQMLAAQALLAVAAIIASPALGFIR